MEKEGGEENGRHSMHKQLTLKFFIGAGKQIIKDVESPLFPGLANGPGLLQQICQALLKKLGRVMFWGMKVNFRLSFRLLEVTAKLL